MANSALDSDKLPSFDLDGKTALVVGGYGAIGRTISCGLARFGATTIIAGRQENKASALANQIVADGRRAHGVAFDAENVSDTRRRIDALVLELGPIDILINCLGIQREQSILETTEEAFDELYRVNLKSGMFLAQAVAHHQITRGRGGKQTHILSIRSALGLRDRGYSAYCSFKGGLAALVRQHAAELAAFGIAVNGVAPSAVRTYKNERAASDPTTYSRMIERTPLRRLAEPADVAGAALFLSSPAADFITGQIIFVDGGQTACQ